MGKYRGMNEFKRLWLAAGHSLDGLRWAWQESAFRLDLLLVLAAVPLGLWLGEDGTQRALLVFSVLLVPLVEVINTAVEAAIDRIGSERHELSGRAKDLGSAAVLVALLNAAVVWILVLFF